jgi:glutamate N-acetyltransferase/amino-acid N-acetyltransferase
MAGYSSAQQYLEELQRRSALPEGFAVSTTSLEFTSRERGQRLPMNLALILLEQPTPHFGGVFTRNRFAGAPIQIGRQRLEQETLRGVLINNKIANVGAPGGVEDACLLCDALGELFGERGSRFLPASTGIVGWKLPVEPMMAALPALTKGLHNHGALHVARAIMTTDSYPKIHREKVGEGSILGLAKGAGMIEPNLATMLAFILTDLAVPRDELRRALSSCVEESFNRISVDGDQSTSDMVLLFSSASKPAVPAERFREALLAVCRRLAEDVVRNGEGVAHVIRVKVEGGASRRIASGAAKAVVNSPLVKAAVFGNDPNVGRVVSALGDFFATADFVDADGRVAEAPFALQRLRITLGGTEIFSEGAFRLDSRKEGELSRYLAGCAFDPTVKGFPAHDRRVEIGIDLGAGRGESEALGADLSYEYVRENADYRT